MACCNLSLAVLEDVYPLAPPSAWSIMLNRAPVDRLEANAFCLSTWVPELHRGAIPFGRGRQRKPKLGAQLKVRRTPCRKPS